MSNSNTPPLHHIGSTSKRKKGPTKCLKTHGLRYDERLPVKLNILSQPVGTYRVTLSNYLGTLARNAHLAPLTFTSWKGLKEHWDAIWKTILWKILIKFWKSDIAKKNKTSRAKFTTVHTTRTKTFAKIRYEEMMKNIDRRESSRVEMFIMTHKPKNEETKKIISKLEDTIPSHSTKLEKNSN
ncbi:putative transposase [Vigna unguiculata]|uniref:Putative transposase n=1 Tax=Vigna unguiculata TaxID=3917 RepID=A0A4D6MQ99_VIGUN|nr:putative transposase [Vigna unguiculata]